MEILPWLIDGTAWTRQLNLVNICLRQSISRGHVMNDQRFATRPEDILDPVERAEISGYDFISGMMTGRYPMPPIAAAMNFRLVEVKRGQVVFQGLPEFDYANPMGTLHGGWYASILDSAMACAIMSSLPAGVQMTTLEFKLNIIRATEFGRKVTTTGKTIHCGRTTAVSEATMTDWQGRTCALSTTTSMLMGT